MSKPTLMQTYAAALAARGEKRVDVIARGEKWTWSFWLQRLPDGSLHANEKGWFFFLGVNGSVRIGARRSMSRVLREELKALLLAEGRAVLAKETAR